MTAKLKKLKKRNICQKCHGTGWLWWYELDDNVGHNINDCTVDDTKYVCDECGCGL